MDTFETEKWRNMEPLSKRKLWLRFCFYLVTTLLLCVSFYFLAVFAGAPKRLAALWVGVYFVIMVVAFGLGFRRMSQNRETYLQPILMPPTRKLVFWMVTGAVVPIFASVLHLGMSFLVGVLIVAIEAAGFSVAHLIESIAWIALGISLTSAFGIWWFLWTQYKDSY